MKPAVVFGGCIHFFMVSVCPVLADVRDCTVWNVLILKVFRKGQVEFSCQHSVTCVDELLHNLARVQHVIAEDWLF